MKAETRMESRCRVNDEISVPSSSRMRGSICSSRDDEVSCSSSSRRRGPILSSETEWIPASARMTDVVRGADIKVWHFMFALLLLITSAMSNAATVPEQSRQLVLVLTANWNATQGELHTYERRATQWIATKTKIAVSIGRTGSAWGIGLHDVQTGLQKMEGDGRSPAGMFALGPAFGYEASADTKIPYRAMTQFDYCIDVTESSLYNQIVDSRVVGQAEVAKSTEPMRRDIHAQGDRRYELGFVIQHNPKNTPAKGSCIFAHLWGKPGQVTAGCTAMAEDSMRHLLAWLDPKAEPVFVLLPYAEYQRLADVWALPKEVAAPK